MRLISWLLVFAGVIITVLIVKSLVAENFAVEKINLKTSDGVGIAANYFPAKNPVGWLLLVHMMPATKESWSDFARELQKSGYSSVAIDLRGHGESEGGLDGYQRFSDAQHQAGIHDLEAAWEFLKSQGAQEKKIAVIGASIGANLALQFLTLNPTIGGGVLLSAGDYKGIDSGQLVKKLSPDQKLLLAASKLDERSGGNNAEQNRQYYDAASQVKIRHLIIFEGAGHGTDLFKLKSEYDLAGAIRKFLEKGDIN